MSGVPTTRLQYGAELFTLGVLFLAHMAMAGSASLNVEMILRVIPPLKSNGWLVLLPHRLCWTWSSAVAHRVAPHSVVDAAKEILTEMKFVSAQTARISHTSKHHSLHTMTKRLMVTHDLILHCVVLLQLECWKESAHHSCILDHYMFYNIQPYIYQSVHQQCIIGSGEALPILCVRYARWERERERERERDTERERERERERDTLLLLLFAGTIFCEFLRFGKNRKNKYPQKFLPTHQACNIKSETGFPFWNMHNHSLWSFLPFLFFLSVPSRARESDVWGYRWSWEFVVVTG